MSLRPHSAKELGGDFEWALRFDSSGCRNNERYARGSEAKVAW